MSLTFKNCIICHSDYHEDYAIFTNCCYRMLHKTCIDIDTKCPHCKDDLKISPTPPGIGTDPWRTQPLTNRKILPTVVIKKTKDV